MPSTRDVPGFSKQLTIIVGLTVVSFMAFGLTLSFYRSIVFEDTLKDIEKQNGVIAKDIEAGYAELEYFRSEQFKDKFAKENMNRFNPGESIIVIAPEKADVPFLQKVETASEKERREQAYGELLRQMPVLEHWKLYLFQKHRIEEMKKAL
jgi:hypothetical protein